MPSRQRRPSLQLALVLSSVDWVPLRSERCRVSSCWRRLRSQPSLPACSISRGSRLPGPSVGHYRGWVYGGAFGAQLGAGLATYVVTWLVYATFLSEALTASPLAGALVGATFGFGRSIALLLAVVIDRPSRLGAFHRRMADLGVVVHRIAAAGSAVVALALVGSVLL